jgi:hypothetical protein
VITTFLGDLKISEMVLGQVSEVGVRLGMGNVAQE